MEKYFPSNRSAVCYAAITMVAQLAFAVMGIYFFQTFDFMLVCLSFLLVGGICTYIVLANRFIRRMNRILAILYFLLFAFTVPISVILCMVMHVPFYVVNLIWIIGKKYHSKDLSNIRVNYVVVILMIVLAVLTITAELLEDNHRGAPSESLEVAFTNQYPRSAILSIQQIDEQCTVVVSQGETGILGCSLFLKSEDGLWSLKEKMTPHMIQRANNNLFNICIYRSALLTDEVILVRKFLFSVGSPDQLGEQPVDSLGSCFVLVEKAAEVGTYCYYVTVADFDSDGYWITGW